MFPGTIALPFLIGLLISGKTPAFPRGPATIAAILVFCCLMAAAVPMSHRANRQSIAISEAVLAQAAESNAKHILLATDSSSLNEPLRRLAMAVSPSRSPVETANLAWRGASGSPMEMISTTLVKLTLSFFRTTKHWTRRTQIRGFPNTSNTPANTSAMRLANGLRIYGVGPNQR